jgi:hypothetical protein
METEMHIGARGVVGLTLLLSLQACITYDEAVLTGNTVEIDQATGDTLITSYWQYHNGATAMTFKRIRRGNTDRRRDYADPPPARIRD